MVLLLLSLSRRNLLRPPVRVKRELMMLLRSLPLLKLLRRKPSLKKSPRRSPSGRTAGASRMTAGGSTIYSERR